MPEVGISEIDLLKDIKASTPDGRDHPSKSVLEQLTKDNEREYIGSGSEVVVVGSKEKEEQVIAINYADLTPEKAKEIFYLQRVFSTLFPHNFPHFYAAFGKNSTDSEEIATGTVRQLIEGNTAEFLDTSSNDHAFPFAVVDNVCRELDLPVGFDPGDAKNFLISAEDDGVYYVDTIVSNKNKSWHIDRVVEYMNKAVGGDGSKQYSEADIKTVKGSIGRLVELGLAKVDEPNPTVKTSSEE